MPTAIVTGATGILGRAIVEELASHPQQWTEIHSFSRSKSVDFPARVKHHHIDLKSSAQTMASDLEGIKADYVFFSAYLQSGSEQQLCDDNGAMLKNFLEALEASGDAKHLKRVILVTGAKQYGVHLGRPKNPMSESDPWLTGNDWPPNFYYVQQHILKSAAEKAGTWDWTVTYPNDVIGVAKGNFMNLGTSLGLYAAVTREMGSKTLPFPGSEVFYSCYDSFTTAKMHAKFCAWAAVTPAASNQAFNVVDGEVTSWQTMWPQVAAHFGLQVPPNQFADGAKHEVEVPLAPHSPISVLAAEMGLQGTDVVKQAFVRQRVDLTKWAKRADVQEAWKRLAERENLEKDALDKATWAFLGFVLGREFDIVISMKKAREAGWTGYQDSWTGLKDVFVELQKEKVLPPTK